jgi:hypothetical protein
MVLRFKKIEDSDSIHLAASIRERCPPIVLEEPYNGRYTFFKIRVATKDKLIT